MVSILAGIPFLYQRLFGGRQRVQMHQSEQQHKYSTYINKFVDFVQIIQQIVVELIGSLWPNIPKRNQSPTLSELWLGGQRASLDASARHQEEPLHQQPHLIGIALSSPYANPASSATEVRETLSSVQTDTFDASHSGLSSPTLKCFLHVSNKQTYARQHNSWLKKHKLLLTGCFTILIHIRKGLDLAVLGLSSASGF